MKKTKKTIKKTTGVKKTTPKKVTKKVTGQSKLQQLRVKERNSAKAMRECANTWDGKIKKAKTAEQKKKINARFQPKFNKLDKLNTKHNIDIQICKLQTERKKLG